MSSESVKSLERYALSPNTAVDHLEQHLGIKFPFRPAMVELTGKNRLVYAWENGCSGIVAALLKRNREALAVYKHTHQAFFAERDVDLFTALHENMHGFNAGTNPEIYDALTTLSKAMSEAVLGKLIGSVEVEKAIVVRSFDEGMAQWGAITTAEKMPEDFEVVSSMKNFMLQGARIEGPVDIDEQFVDSYFNNLSEAAQTYQAAFNLQGMGAIKEGMKAEEMLAEAKYITGFYFVNQAMLHLTEQGLTLGEAITQLVKNPPTTIKDLRNPASYVFPS